MIRRHRRSPLFPTTPLSRSPRFAAAVRDDGGAGARARGGGAAGGAAAAPRFRTDRARRADPAPDARRSLRRARATGCCRPRHGWRILDVPMPNGVTVARVTLNHLV